MRAPGWLALVCGVAYGQGIVVQPPEPVAADVQPELVVQDRGPRCPVNAVAFSPDGKVLAAGGEDGSIWLWEMASGLPQGAPLRLHVKILSVAFSPDGMTLAAGSTDATVLFNVATGRSRYTLGPPSAGAASLAFSPDGQLLATGATRSGRRCRWRIRITTRW